jgi:hypothetical protein
VPFPPVFPDVFSDGGATPGNYSDLYSDLYGELGDPSVPASVAERNAILNAYLPGASHAAYSGNTSLFLSIHTGDPGDSGASEYTAYSGGLRPSISFGAAASATATSAAQIDYTAMGSTTITHVGLWTANTGGTFKGGGSLSTAKTTISGDTLRFLVAAVTAQIQ